VSVQGPLAIAALAVAALSALIVPPILRRRRRRIALARSLPAALAEVADRRVATRVRLPTHLRRRHDGLINAFLAEKRFVGCNGLVVTDEMRATIAAQACLLVLGRPDAFYDELQSILVYPAPFWVENEVHDENGTVTQRREVLSGEAWDAHRIILSWEDIAGPGAAPGEGFNVVLHEFAHYLQADGQVGGNEEWAGDMAEEFNRLLDAVERGEETFLDPYATEDEAEFFAVATEEFYERPGELLARHPRLYSRLQEFYGVNPAAWISAP
jgi:Mlc titration factor MtfA (ptsG expression regulator)